MPGRSVGVCRNAPASAAPASGDGPPVLAGRRRRALAVFPTATVVLFVAPVALGLGATLAPALGYFPALGGTVLSLAPLRTVLADPAVPAAAGISLVSGVGSTALALLLVIGFLAAWHDSVWVRVARRLLSPLLAIPHAAAAVGLAFLIAPSGWLARLLSPWATGWDRPPDLLVVQDPWGLALLAGLTVKEIPFLLLIALSALGQLDTPAQLRMARSLGYRPTTAWIKVVLPQLVPHLRLPVCAVLAYGLSTVDMAMILGPSTPPTLSVLVLRWAQDPDLGFRFLAAAGAIAQLGLVAVAIGLWLLAVRLYLKGSVGRWTDGLRGRSDRLLKTGAMTALVAVLTTAFLGLVALGLWSAAGRWRYPDPWPTAWSVDPWGRAMAGLDDAVATTIMVGIASVAIGLVLVVGCLEHERRTGRRAGPWALWILYAPLLVPQVTFLFGLQLVLVAARLDGTWTALILSHLLFVVPYLFLALAEPWRRLDPRLRAAAATLGLGPFRALAYVIAPVLLRPILVAAAIGFSVSAAQYLPTLFAGAGRLTTLTVEVVGLARGADRRVVGAAAFLQAMLPLAVFAIAVAAPRLVYRNRRALRRW